MKVELTICRNFLHLTFRSLLTTSEIQKSRFDWVFLDVGLPNLRLSRRRKVVLTFTKELKYCVWIIPFHTYKYKFKIKGLEEEENLKILKIHASLRGWVSYSCTRSTLICLVDFQKIVNTTCFALIKYFSCHGQWSFNMVWDY